MVSSAARKPDFPCRYVTIILEHCTEHMLDWNKVVALNCGFLNLFEDDFNTFRKVREGATIIVLWEIWLQNGSTYRERDNGTDRLQKFVYINTFVFTIRIWWNPVESGRMDAFLQKSVRHQKVQSKLDGVPQLSSSLITASQQLPKTLHNSFKLEQMLLPSHWGNISFLNKFPSHWV